VVSEFAIIDGRNPEAISSTRAYVIHAYIYKKLRTDPNSPEMQDKRIKKRRRRKHGIWAEFSINK
jgi:hypothetical protein